MERERLKKEKQAKFEAKKAKLEAEKAAKEANKEKKEKKPKAVAEPVPEYVEETPKGEKKSLLQEDGELGALTDNCGYSPEIPRGPGFQVLQPSCGRKCLV